MKTKVIVIIVNPAFFLNRRYFFNKGRPLLLMYQLLTGDASRLVRRSSGHIQNCWKQFLVPTAPWTHPLSNRYIQQSGLLPARKYGTLTYMKVIGIVAEYNPLHNGHVYQIEYAKKELNADAIVVVLAGDFLQRGLPAVMERTLRAKAAVDAGADVVFEMPTVVATSSANDYALGSIALLHHCGVVTDLLFGCENGTDDDF